MSEPTTLQPSTTDGHPDHGDAPPLPRRLGWQRLAFSVPVLLCLALLGLNGVLVLQPSVYDGVLNPFVVGGAASHFESQDHLIHDLSFTFLFATSALGLLAQLRSPHRHLAGQLMAIVPWLSMTLMIVLADFSAPSVKFPREATFVYGGLTISAALYHPRGRDLFRSFRPSHASLPLAALVAAALIPQLVFVATNISRQRDDTANDIHQITGHYGFMAAFAMTSIAVAAIASFRPVGWRLTAWTAGALPTLLGVLSLLAPDIASSLSAPWAIAAIAWGVTFVVVAERHQDHAHGADNLAARTTVHQ